MILFKKYTSIPKYLERFTIFKIFNIHIRIHNILSEDKSTFLHNHPFNYFSFIISGGYTEEISINGNIITKIHNKYKLLYRNNKTYHRIKFVEPNTKTLFVALGNSKI